MIKENKDKGIKTLIWDKISLKLIDQRELPFKKDYINCTNYREAGRAIKDMVVRGAPAIGVTAAYGVALAALEAPVDDRGGFINFVEEGISYLSEARPTAVNLFWALERMRNVLNKNKKESVEHIKELLIREAEIIEQEDLKINRNLGDNSIQLFKDTGKKVSILTHCNAGALATAGYGTALGVIRSLNREGIVEKVIVDETRPYLQGARLTAWEIHEENIPFFIITDNMAGYFMSIGEIDAVVVGADRVAGNGDSANKIGTLSVSILAKYYSIPFYIAAPLSTIDMNIKSGEEIVIEERPKREVRHALDKRIIPEYMDVRNPAFDVTPAENIKAIITEAGIAYPPFVDNIKKLFKKD